MGNLAEFVGPKEGVKFGLVCLIGVDFCQKMQEDADGDWDRVPRWIEQREFSKVCRWIMLPAVEFSPREKALIVFDGIARFLGVDQDKGLRGKAALVLASHALDWTKELVESMPSKKQRFECEKLAVEAFRGFLDIFARLGKGHGNLQDWESNLEAEDEDEFGNEGSEFSAESVEQIIQLVVGMKQLICGFESTDCFEALILEMVGILNADFATEWLAKAENPNLIRTLEAASKALISFAIEKLNIHLETLWSKGQSFYCKEENILSLKMIGISSVVIAYILDSEIKDDEDPDCRSRDSTGKWFEWSIPFLQCMFSSRNLKNHIISVKFLAKLIPFIYPGNFQNLQPNLNVLQALLSFLPTVQASDIRNLTLNCLKSVFHGFEAEMRFQAFGELLKEQLISEFSNPNVLMLLSSMLREEIDREIYSTQNFDWIESVLEILSCLCLNSFNLKGQVLFQRQDQIHLVLSLLRFLHTRERDSLAKVHLVRDPEFQNMLKQQLTGTHREICILQNELSFEISGDTIPDSLHLCKQQLDNLEFSVRLFLEKFIISGRQ